MKNNRSNEYFEMMKTFKKLCVIMLPINIIGLSVSFYYLITNELQLGTLSAIMLSFTVIATLLGVYFVKKWNYYK